jgi:hypothetical protein
VEKDINIVVLSNTMYVLLGVSDETVENETFVYFIGVFSTVRLVMESRNALMKTKQPNSLGCNKSGYIIKEITIDTIYDYNWCDSEDNEIKDM